MKHHKNNGGTKRLDEQTAKILNRNTSPLDLSAARPWRVGLNIHDRGVELIFDLTEELPIGRSYPETEYFDGLDLGPFGAYEYGISRRHALLRLHNNHIALMDTESANGTFINDHRLEPNEVYPLRNGDQVKFGMLAVTVNLLINPFERA